MVKTARSVLAISLDLQAFACSCHLFQAFNSETRNPFDLCGSWNAAFPSDQLLQQAKLRLAAHASAAASYASFNANSRTAWSRAASSRDCRSCCSLLSGSALAAAHCSALASSGCAFQAHPPAFAGARQPRRSLLRAQTAVTAS